MCSTKCAEEHSKMPECLIIAGNLPRLPDQKENHERIDYQAILPLRCLLEKESTNWNYLQMFEDHCQVKVVHSK